MADESRVMNLLLKLYNVKAGQTLPQYSALSGYPNRDPFSYYSTQYSEDRIAKYREYDAMNQSSGEINVALNTYAEESTQFSIEQKRTVWATSEDDETVEILHDFFEALDLENKIFGISRHLAQYGDLFLFPVVDATAGIQDFIAPHPTLVSVEFDQSDYNKVIGYKCEAVEIVDPNTGQPFPKDMAVRSAEGFSPWDWVHFKIPGSDLSSHYGVSMIEAARRTWKTLAMLETAIALYRINKAGNRLLFKIDTGSAAPREALQIVQEYVRSLKSTPYLSITDPAKGGQGTMEEYLERWKQNAFLDDIFWPLPKESQSGVEVLTIPPDIGAIEDLEYFKNKFRTALGIPKAYFDGDISGWGANKALAQQDVQFARKMERLQKAIINGLNQLCSLHLLYLGKQQFSFTIHMEQPSALGTLQRLEVQKVKLDTAIEQIGAADTFGFDKVRWTVQVLQNTMEMSMEEIQKLMVRVPDPAMITPGMVPGTVAGSLGGVDAFSQGDGAPISGSMAATPPTSATPGQSEGLVTSKNFKEFMENIGRPKSVRSSNLLERPYNNGQEDVRRIHEEVPGDETPLDEA